MYKFATSCNAFKGFILSFVLFFIGTPLATAEKKFPINQFAFYTSNYDQRLTQVARLLPSEDNKIFEDIKAYEAGGQYRQVAFALERILTKYPKDASLWISLSRNLLLSKPLDTQDSYNLPILVVGSALKGYQLSTSPQDKAISLKFAAEGLVRRQTWREALIAYKESLALVTDPETQRRYEEINEQYGFRISNYTVESDVTSPRACFQFTDPLSQTLSDFLPFFKQEPGPVSAVTAEGSRLCVDALKHGERYTINVRQGLPSALGDVLPRDFEYEFYVKDIRPTVRFVSKSYILPSTGQNGIPFISVNSQSANISFYKIGDRNLLSAVLNSDFRSQLYSYSENEISERLGKFVWKGDIETPSQLNEEKIFAFPIQETLGKIEPGLYVMTAKPSRLVNDDGQQIATQWFVVSDLGLSTTHNKDGLHVTVRSLATAKPLGDIQLRLIARNNEVLATDNSNAEGNIDFAPGLTKGEGGLAPALVVAQGANNDYTFLDLTQSAFDLSDRGVAGRASGGKIQGFVYAERGVYRRGETVHAVVLLRDEKSEALPSSSLFLTLERPDGVVLSKTTLKDSGGSSYSYDFTVNPNAQGGKWTLKAFTDPKLEPVGQTTFLVEDYLPETIEFDLKTKSNAVLAKSAENLNFSIDGRYLFGAPASGLDIEAELSISTNKTPFQTWKDYYFGRMDERVDPLLTVVNNLPKTDIAGKAEVSPQFPNLPQTTKPLKLDAVFRLREPGGRAVERNITIPVISPKPLFGIKPNFDISSAPEGQNSEFEVIALNPEGRPVPVPNATWNLKRLETRYQWFNSDGYWKWESVTRASKFADGQLKIEEGPAKFSRALEWGEYRLEISADGFTSASLDFSVGFYSSSNSKAETPDTLKVALDKTDIKSGETINIKIEGRVAGSLTLQVVGDRQFYTKSFDMPKEGMTIPLTVEDDWGTGAYILATFYRPMDVKARRMPARSIGVAWFGINRASRELSLKLTPEEKIKPRGTLSVPVKVEGLTSGEEAFLTMAAVDVGILNLTKYKPPAPEKFYLDQKNLSAEIRDVYGSLLDGMEGEIGKVRSGGDGGETISGPPPTQAPLSLFSGIVKVNQDGSAIVNFEIPSFNGTARVMAVAWTKSKVGHASTDVIVRDPVVTTASLPRFLAVGDASRLRFDFINAEAPSGDYQFKVTADGPLEISRPPLFQKITVGAQGERSNLNFPIIAKTVGKATITANLTGPNGFNVSQVYSLSVLPAHPPVTEQSVVELSANGGSLTLSKDLLKDMLPGTTSVALSINPIPELDAAGLIQDLERYPYGCSEQIVSRAIALLYLDDLSVDPKSISGGVKERISQTLNILLNRQTGSGAFGLWTAYENDTSLWLTSYVTDFLLRARDKGYEVSETSLLNAIDYLRNSVGNSPDVKEGEGQGLAYALYILARAGKAPVGDLKYLLDSKIQNVGSALGKAQLGAAVGILGDKARADKAFTSSILTLRNSDFAASWNREDYGSPLRDASAILTLAVDTKIKPAMLSSVSEIVVNEKSKNYTISTQEMGWMTLAARSVAKGMKDIQLNVNGSSRSGILNSIWTEQELDRGIKISNMGKEAIRAALNITGSPRKDQPPRTNGLRITREYFSTDGATVDISKVQHNKRLVTVLNVSTDEGQPEKGNFLIEDRLPAGFEIENPTLVASGSTSSLAWLGELSTAIHAEFRDDRFVGAFKDSNIKIAYIVRAVTPGQYIHPGASVEDMYKREINARTAAGFVSITSP